MTTEAWRQLGRIPFRCCMEEAVGDCRLNLSSPVVPVAAQQTQAAKAKKAAKNADGVDAEKDEPAMSSLCREDAIVAATWAAVVQIAAARLPAEGEGEATLLRIMRDATDYGVEAELLLAPSPWHTQPGGAAQVAALLAAPGRDALLALPSRLVPVKRKRGNIDRRFCGPKHRRRTPPHPRGLWRRCGRAALLVVGARGPCLPTDRRCANLGDRRLGRRHILSSLHARCGRAMRRRPARLSVTHRAARTIRKQLRILIASAAMGSWGGFLVRLFHARLLVFVPFSDRTDHLGPAGWQAHNSPPPLAAIALRPHVLRSSSPHQEEAKTSAPHLTNSSVLPQNYYLMFYFVSLFAPAPLHPP